MIRELIHLTARHANPSTLATFSATGRDYELLDRPGARAVRLRFIGPFQGQAVLWEARFIAGSDPAQRYIEIGPARGDTRLLSVALDIPRFDEPAIRKTIVMIRQYKRLHEGRMTFGEPYRSA